MEVVGVAETDGVCNLSHRHLCGAKKLHCRIYTHSIDVINGSLADTLLEHLGEVVGRDVDHCGELLNVDLLLIMLVDVINYRTESQNVVIYHTVELVLGATVISEERSHHMIDVRSDGKLVADLLLGILVIGLLHKSHSQEIYAGVL